MTRCVAPEQAGGEAVGPAADVYALASIINDSVAGDFPFAVEMMTPTLMASAEIPFEPHSNLGLLDCELHSAGSVGP